MPGIIDQLVVQLGLDASSLVKGSKDIISSVEKTKTEVVKHGTAIEGAVTKAANSFEALAAKALTVVAIFAGAKSVEQFTAKITNADAAIGRLSSSMGQAPDDISAIGKAVERMGGSADTAMSGMRSLSDAFQQFRTTGTSALLDPMARLQALSGHAVKFGADVKTTLTSVADALAAAKAKDPTQANFLGRQILGSDDLANFAMQGGAALNAGIAKSKQIGVVRPEDVKAAQDLQYAFTSVAQAVEDIGRRIVTAVMPLVSKLLGQLESWLEKNKNGIVTQITKAIEDFGTAVVAHQKDIEAFGSELLAIVTAAGDLAKTLSSEGHLGMALTAFGALALAQVTGPLATLARTMAALGLLNPAVLGTLGIGALLASGDPNKSVLAGGHPDIAPQDNDLGLPGVGDRSSDTGDAKGKLSGAWGWFTSKMQAMGFGDRLKKDDRAADAAVETAEGVKALVKQGERVATGTADAQGVTASSGGLGGSGRHVGGDTSPGASLRDRGQAGRGAGPSALKTGQQKGNAAVIADEMRKAGMSDEGIAAVLGSMQTESGFSPRAHNDVAGGHTGLWQWDARRWAKVRGWIEKQGGDPWDARWQAKAFIAEGRAKPGDAIYDNGNTSGGFDDIMGAKGNLGKAVHGVQRSERFGIGEEGGRAANAGKWLGHLPSAADVPGAGAGTPAPSGAAVTDGEVFKARQRIINGSKDPKDHALVERYKAQQAKPEKTSFLNGLYRQAPMHVASIAANAHAAAHHSHTTTTHQNDNSSETHIGSIAVHTNATDAQGIVADIGPALRRGQKATQSQYGLA